MTTTRKDRATTLGKQHLDAAIARIGEDLADSGLGVLDLAHLRPLLEAELEKFFDVEDAVPAGRVLAEFGGPGDEVAAPAGYWRSVALCTTRAVLERLGEVAAVLEKAEDQKLETWVKSRFGNEAEVDFRRLAVRQQLPMGNGEIGVLKLARQLVEAPPEKRRVAVQNTQSASGGVEQFVGDFAKALLSGERLAQLLTDMWHLATPEEIDAVVDGAHLEGTPHDHVVRFYAGLLKKRAALDDQARAQVDAGILAKAA